MATNPAQLWSVIRPFLAPIFLCALVLLTLREPLVWWLQGEERYDQEALREWLREARVFQTLPELVQAYLALADRYQRLEKEEAPSSERHATRQRMAEKREEIEEHLRALGNPPTRMYPGQLPLFPVIYRLAVTFDPATGLPPILWDSDLPRHRTQYQELTESVSERGAQVTVQYHLHAFSQRQYQERREVTRRLWLSGLGLLFALAAMAWVYVSRRRDRDRQRQKIQAEQQLMAAERLRLHEELRRQEAERRQQEAERHALELRSQLFANIGIMAGSYAHNIKNLLVRPNDLLRRCLEDQELAEDQAHMISEVRQTLGTVTERLQQILQTIRKDPNQSERVKLDLNELARDLSKTWGELAREKWKLTLDLDLATEPLWVEGDHSHLQQALENLLFNARDATFEMRNQLREQARGPTFNREPKATAPDKRQALIAAAAWKGQVTIRTRRDGNQAILELQDNGIGMSEEVRRRCIETHFTTKRNNALFAGLSAGMGLGLSFVMAIMDHHRGKMEIESETHKGATFRMRFPTAT